MIFCPLVNKIFYKYVIFIGVMTLRIIMAIKLFNIYITSGTFPASHGNFLKKNVH